MALSRPKALISVVIPCYNAELTLEKTLRSVAVQGIDHEIIVVDDGSTDRSADIARSFGPSVRYFRTPNRGASAAQNLGTMTSEGQFLQYLDSDDLLTPGTLVERIEMFRTAEVDVVYTDWQKIDENDQVMPGSLRTLALPATVQDAEIAIAKARFWAPPGSFMYRRTIVERIPGWNTDLKIVHDVRFLLDACRAGASFCRVPHLGLQYRIRPDSLSHESPARFIADCARFARQLEGIWSSPGPVTQLQSSALAEIWGHVATASLVNGLPEFDEAVSAHNRFARPNPKFEVGRAMRRLLDARQCALVAQRYIALKTLLLGRVVN
jgi:glycosyltransferase involved in cell wall biosynthesis